MPIVEIVADEKEKPSIEHQITGTDVETSTTVAFECTFVEVHLRREPFSDTGDAGRLA